MIRAKILTHGHNIGVRFVQTTIILIRTVQAMLNKGCQFFLLLHRNYTHEKWGLFTREKFLYSVRILFVISLVKGKTRTGQLIYT